MPRKRFYIETLGCPKNQVDSEALRHRLLEGDLQETDLPEEADYIIVNTCTFIKEAKEETIDVVLSLGARKRPGQKLVMLGCMVQRYGDVLRRELPEVDYFVGFDELDAFLESLNCRSNGLRQDYLPETFPYAYLKITEGCHRGCTFCVIPTVRGPLRSLPPEGVLQRAEFLVKKGYRELVLVGQDITSYGMDLGRDYGLKELIRDLDAIGGEFWIRLLYLYPASVDEGLLGTVSESRKVCPYLDIPLQHSEERILRLMGRPGNRKTYKEFAHRARATIPGLHLRSAFIVGFPTEREEEFQALLDFVREVGFDHLGAFKYSEEEGTKAEALEPKVPEEIKQMRYEALMQTQAEISRQRLSIWPGTKTTVLIDSVEEGLATARHPGQAPEVDGIVLIKDPQGLKPGEFVEVFIEETTTYDLIGRPC